jgi:hypothetical protein
MDKLLLRKAGCACDAMDNNNEMMHSLFLKLKRDLYFALSGLDGDGLVVINTGLHPVLWISCPFRALLYVKIPEKN